MLFNTVSVVESQRSFPKHGSFFYQIDEQLFSTHRDKDGYSTKNLHLKTSRC